MTIVYFVRHAHSIYSPDEYNRSLSLKGLQDANFVTNRLKDQQINAVISSPYKRAIETVQGIADAQGRQVIVLEELKERIVASGAVADFEETMCHLWSDPNFAYEGGESNHDAQKRAIPTFNEILKQYENTQIVVGTHGNILTLILNAFDPAIGLAFWRELKMPDIIKAEFHQLELLSLKRMKL